MQLHVISSRQKKGTGAILEDRDMLALARDTRWKPNRHGAHTRPHGG